MGAGGSGCEEVAGERLIGVLTAFLVLFSLFVDDFYDCCLFFSFFLLFFLPFFFVSCFNPI